MNHIFILEADPTEFGGIQQFVRNLAGYLPEERVTLLAYYGALAQRKNVNRPLHILPPQNRCFAGILNKIYRSGAVWRRNLALLCDIPVIRRRLEQRLDRDTLVVNSMFAMFFLCTRKVLQNNRIILVQHTCPRMLKRNNYDFGGLFKKWKIRCFEQYADTFVLLSPYEKAELEKWLPLENKKCPVIRHAIPFPEQRPIGTPGAAAVLARFVSLKRIDRVIECAKLLPDVTFNLYGSGPEEDKLRRLASRLPNVVFRGYTNDIDAVFQENSLLLITSEYEGYPVSGIEACVHARPVVVLNTFPAARDLVAEGVNGAVLDDCSPGALAAAVRKILTEIGKYGEGASERRGLYDVAEAKKIWNRLLLSVNDNTGAVS